MKTKEIYKWVDFELTFDELGFIETNITKSETQEKIDDLLNIQKDYEYLAECNSDLRKLKRVKKKSKEIQEEISFLEREIDEIEQYINSILQTVTKH